MTIVIVKPIPETQKLFCNRSDCKITALEVEAIAPKALAVARAQRNELAGGCE
jgi:hypothetical protein